MKIGLFLGSAGSRSGGPERYEVELVRALARLDQDNEYHLVCLMRSAPDLIGIDQANIAYHVLFPRSRVVSMLTSLPLKLASLDPKVVHATYIPPLAHPSYMFTLVCSSMFEHPEFYPPAIRARLVFLMKRAVRKARLILCISEHIRNVIQDRFAVPEERVAVAHLGVSPAFRPFDRGASEAFLRERYALEAPYFLFSGRWEPRKNILRIIKAFAAFKRETRLATKLVFTGERTWAAEEADRLIAQEGLTSEVRDLGKSPVEELPILYSGAEALVFPSLWEGFGLPIVEAMAAGTPVITSNNSSMAEIGGDAALLVDPLSAEDIAGAMHRIVTDAEACDDLRRRGLERAARFTWERTAQQTLSAYRQMANAA